MTATPTPAEPFTPYRDSLPDVREQLDELAKVLIFTAEACDMKHKPDLDNMANQLYLLSRQAERLARVVEEHSGEA